MNNKLGPYIPGLPEETIVIISATGSEKMFFLFDLFLKVFYAFGRTFICIFLCLSPLNSSLTYVDTFLYLGNVFVACITCRGLGTHFG